MDDEAPRRNLHERTGKHVCIRCMREVPEEEYFRNDFFCDECVAQEEVATGEKAEGRRQKDE